MKPGGQRPKAAPLPPAPAGQTAAILKLLGDEDDSMVKLVLQQLLADRNTARPRIEGLLKAASGPAAGQLRGALTELRRGEALEALRFRCSRIGTLGDLEDFCWKLALYHDPEAEVGMARARLDAWALEVRAEVAPGASALERLEALRVVLADGVGLRGNAENYYHPDNSFLDRVVASRRGIPISLTAIYMLVGARAGIEVEPIGMPGHFLARVGARYLDPFHEGLVVDREALLDLMERSGEPAAEEALEAIRHPLPLALMAQRMVLNVVNIHQQAGAAEEAARWRLILEWIRPGEESE